MALLLVGALLLGTFVAPSQSLTNAATASQPLVAQPVLVVQPVAPELLVAQRLAADLPLGGRGDIRAAADDEVPFFPAPDPTQTDTSADSVADGSAVAAGPPLPMPVAEPAPVQWRSGPPLLTTDAAIANAASLLGIPYVWGGNSNAGLDCSAYVSRAWGLTRQTTDTLGRFSSPISKDELLPGDIMNLTTSQDPRHYGHVRMFAAWANAERSRVWVYEETPRQSIYHVIAYDARYTPMRRQNLVVDGVIAPMVAAPADAPAQLAQATNSNNGSGGQRSKVTGARSTPAPTDLAQRTGTATATPERTRRQATSTPTVTPWTFAPTPEPTVLPTQWPVATTAPRPVVVAATPQPTHTPTPPPSTPTVTPAPAPTRTPTPIVTPTATRTPTATPRITSDPTPRPRRNR